MKPLSTVSTSKCAKWNHREFRLHVESTLPQNDVNTFANWLESCVQNGTSFQAGQTIEFGSMLLRVSAFDSFLTLEEPDLQEFPISWKSGISESLKLLRLQKDIADSVGLADHLEFPSILSSLLVAADLPAGHESLFLDRAPSESDSGWFIGRRDSQLDYNDPSNLIRESVYRGFLNWPRIRGFSALPPGCRVEIADRTEIFHNGRQLNARKGSLLDSANFKLCGLDRDA